MRQRLVAAQTLSSFAIWLDFFLLFAVPTYAWHASSGDLAIIAALLGLPMLVLGPFVGALADRSDLRRWIIGGLIARTALSLLAAVVPSLTLYFAIVLFKGLANLVHGSFMSVVINRSVTKDERTHYFATVASLDQVTKIVTPAAAGALALMAPMQMVFLASATATILCLGVLLPLLSTLQPVPTDAAAKSGANLFKVLAGLLSLPAVLRTTATIAVIMSLALSLYDPHLVNFVKAHGFDPWVFSSVVSATAVGGVTAGLLIRHPFAKVPSEQLRAIGCASFCLSLAIIVVVINFRPSLLSPVFLMLVWVLNGFGYQFHAVATSVLIQGLSPASDVGRLSASIRSAQMLCLVGAPSLGAVFIDSFGRNSVFLLSLSLCIAAVIASFTAVRRGLPGVPAPR